MAGDNLDVNVRQLSQPFGRAAVIAALACIFTSPALAARLVFPAFAGDDPVLSLAVPSALGRTLQTIDGVVALGPMEAANPPIPLQGQPLSLLGSLKAQAIISGTVQASGSRFSATLTLETSDGRRSLAAVSAASFPALVRALDTQVIQSIPLTPSTKDTLELRAVQEALPTPTIAAAAGRLAAGDMDLLKSAAGKPWADAARAVLLARAGDTAQALPLAVSAAKASPSDPVAQAILAGVALTAGKPDQAEVAARQAIALNPANPDALYALGVAILAGPNGNTNAQIRAAGTQLGRALQANPLFINAALPLADVFVALSAPDQALAMLDALDASYPRDPRLIEKTIGLHLGLDDGLAATYLADITARGGEPESVFLLAGRLLDPDAGLAIAAAGRVAYPQSAALARMNGVLLERLGRFSDAVAAYRAAAALDANSAAPLLAAALAKTGQIDPALTALGANAGPSVVTAVFIRAGRLEEAAKQAALIPAGYERDYLQGVIAVRQGRFAEGLQLLRAAATARAASSDVNAALQEALDAQRLGWVALAADPAHFLALGQGALAGGEPLEAGWAFTEALKGAAGNGVLAFYKGLALFRAGETDLAVESLNAADAALPSNSLVKSNLGAALAAQGRFDLALDALSAAVNLDPNYARAWMSLAEAQAGVGLSGPAQASEAKAVGLDPGLNIEGQALLDAINGRK